MVSPEIRRKRPRSFMSGSGFVWIAFMTKSSRSISVRPLISTSRSLASFSTTATTTSLFLATTDISTESTTALPPWLTTTTRDTQLDEELQWLEWELRERQMDHADEILQALPVICQGRTDWMLGCIDFLQTLLQLEEIATPTVLLASMVHYVECVIARMDGVYDAVQQRLSAGVVLSNHRLALPPSISSIDEKEALRMEVQQHEQQTTSRKVNLDQQLLPLHDDGTLRHYIPEVIQLSNSASQIKRAEIIAEVALPRQTDYENVQNLLVSVTGDDWRALAIRCVASLYRLRQSAGRHPQTIATARSAIHIYAPLAQRMGLHVLKTQLESKAFRILYPRQYHAALSLFERQGDSMLAVSRYLQQQITNLLQQDSNLAQADIQVTTRVKEPYSFWKKLLRKQRNKGTGRSMIMRFDSELSRRELTSILQVRDGVALRVIVQAPPISDESESDRRTRDQLLCYYVHQLIRAVFPETNPHQVKDYIASPKPNGYQSLHHTSVIRMDQLEIPFEIQVRSQEMHRIAEYGLAAHWDYKQQQSLALPPSLPSNHQVKDLQDTMHFMIDQTSSQTSNTPYLQALEIARKSLVESSVFVFVAGTTYEHGQLVSVKKGQRIGDVWAALLSERRLNQVWRNGRLADLEEQVQNGDVLLFQEEQSKLLQVSAAGQLTSAVS